MVKLADFNNVLSIGFAISAIFVYIDILPMLDQKFQSILDLKKSRLADILDDKKLHWKVTFGGWQHLAFAHTFWIKKLKFYSVFSSLLSFFLLILAGYFPEIRMGYFLISLILFVIFMPIAWGTWTLLYRIRKARFNMIRHNLEQAQAQTSDPEKFATIKEAIENLDDILEGMYISRKEWVKYGLADGEPPEFAEARRQRRTFW